MAVIFGLGVIIGYYGRSFPGPDPNDVFVNKVMGDQFKLEAQLIKSALENVASNQIREFHKILTKEPHIAGLRRDNELTNWIVDNWKAFGLDKVELAEYDFYLTWPNQVKLNKIIEL